MLLFLVTPGERWVDSTSPAGSRAECVALASFAYGAPLCYPLPGRRSLSK